jgi:trigger factor
VNVTVENLGPCKKLLRFEIDPAKVDEQFESTTRDYVKHAALPGFRPGKAPRDMIAKKFEKEIADEVKKKLIGDAYHDALKQHKINPTGYPDIDEVDCEKGKPLQFVANLETAPDFELPAYRNLPAKRETGAVTDDDITRALDILRNQRAQFNAVQRPVKEGDIAVVNYTGTCEGKPLTDFSPTAKGLTEKKNFWIEVKPGSFIPGFTEKLTGANVGEKRTIEVDFPADFVTPQLQGKKGVYEVEVTEVKERALPTLDNEFAKTFGAEDLDRLRDGIRSDLQNELNLKRKKAIREQILKTLMESVNFDLPETLVQQETRHSVYEIVNNAQQKGASKEIIEQQKDEIYSIASRAAKDRVKLNLILERISEKEGIRASEQELNARLVYLAGEYKMTPDKFVKELEKGAGVYEIHRQILNEKTVDFLAENAKIEDVPVGQAEIK